ncbi:hypothetical protein [Peribacillus frigoritolerans]|uniref:hypothetical protein n=1 Tax=Peribacillus frigoritolerans TaxID=450367 RepID=UPI0034447FC4
MDKNKKYPLKHVSLRVPWHDSKWNGTVCKHPGANQSCLILKNCALNRDDEKESQLAGKSIEHLSQDQLPSCVGERGTFMSDFSFTRILTHPYQKNKNANYEHFKETPLRHPAYSAGAVPFLWMMRSEAEKLAKFYELDVDLEREPDLGFNTIWVQEYQNQKNLLDFLVIFSVMNHFVFFMQRIFRLWRRTVGYLLE